MSQVKVTTLMNSDGSKQATSTDIIDGATKTKLFSPFSLAMLAGVDATALRGSMVAAKSGANSDITSLTGLTTPLSTAQGGTGATSMGAGAVGAVTQAAGVPTGAIIQTGSSTVGTVTTSYVKYADGTLICTAVTDYAAVGTTTAMGNIWSGSAAPTLDYPVPFTALYNVRQNFVAQGLAAFTTEANLSSLTQWAAVIPMSAYNTGATTYPMRLYRFAMGRWF